MPFLEYPVTRPVVLSRWVTLSFFVAWVAWIVFVTLVSVVAVGYENNTVPSTDFNNTADYRLWYQKIRIPHSLIVASWSCSYSVIKVNEGYSPLHSYLDISCACQSWNRPLHSSRIQRRNGRPTRGWFGLQQQSVGQLRGHVHRIKSIWIGGYSTVGTNIYC